MLFEDGILSKTSTSNYTSVDKLVLLYIILRKNRKLNTCYDFPFKVFELITIVKERRTHISYSYNFIPI